MADRSSSFKEALFESLSAVLSSEHDVRIAGEDQVKALEVTEEFGVHLAEFTVDPNGALAIRQLASVLLKQYVEAHWSQHSDKFRPPETTENAKKVIREILPLGLQESISKVRSSVAYAVSAIAHWDWPEEWPQLFDILMQALTSGNHNLVHGAMRVLTEFSREVTDIQMQHVAPVILPEMFKIFTNDQVYSIRTRGRAVDIFNTCAGLIVAMNELQRGVAKQLLFPVLPQFTEAFIKALQVRDGATSDSGLKEQVLTAITTLVKSFPSHMSSCLAEILLPVWTTLTESADTYIKTVINDSEEADDPVDSDGEVLGFENLVFSIFEFIHAMVDTPKLRKTLKKSLSDLMYYIVCYMQITQDQVRLWSNAPDQFVEDEDDDTFSYSVRISAQDLLLSLAAEFPKESALAICAAVERHLQEAGVMKAAGNLNWWKVHEAGMLCLGSVRQLIIDSVENKKLQFNISHYIENVVIPDLNSNASDFLLGRCLWTASRYSECLPPDLLQKCLQMTVSGLHVTQSPVVRISAVRASYGYCMHLKTINEFKSAGPYVSEIIDGLVAIATQFSCEVLALCLETLCVVLEVDDELTAKNESKITPLAIAILLKYPHDHHIVGLSQDVFKVMADNQLCYACVEQRLLPTLVSILQAPADKMPIGMAAICLDCLVILVRASPSQQPLSEALIHTAFPAAVHCILKSDDSSCLQNGGECLRAFVSRALDQIALWQHSSGSGNNGVYYVVQVIVKLLDPKTSEYTASFVGRLIATLFSKCGTQLGENLDLILRAVLSKLQQAETLSVIQSLVLVFAHLMHSQMHAVLDFLSSVPDPTGKPALHFVLTEWCSKQHLFYGAYESKVSSVALCKLMQHAIENNDSRLQSIIVTGEQIVSASDGVRTRSKAASSDPEQWTKIPVLVKMYKLLINELSNQIENALSKETADDEGWDEDEEDEEDDEEEEEGGSMRTEDSIQGLLNQFASAADFPGYDAVEDIDEEQDEDALNDPISQVDLKQYLTEFIMTLSQQPYYEQFSSHHNEQEKHLLSSIGVPLPQP
ncbi:hypothetical protein CAPTEDRAFT_225381 [Capitella teleta]|uniref:Importin N-terminal domain-containing protein n=1 Tax=Capitella teleta TaxID=283909 RepID=R7TCF3_CAPTE|nr:hypothetical protein CAPTEDRAFT_225381 [Capitella teleta]|eukprot:ELT91403.1 hypothetical protein CAPTEDRAFT_225381 [Capitella teleta]